jgi:histidinol-phosphate/aromatic aminotransferase/cobyric acid decarboxylase-like protein
MSDCTCRVKVVAVDFESEGKPVDPFTADAIERYRNVMETSNDDGTNIKAILLCNPHNPLGRCFVSGPPINFFLTGGAD